MAGQLLARRSTLVACLLVLAVQTVVLATLSVRGGPHQPHDVPILISAPAVVAQALAEETAALPGRPFDADWTPEAARARAAVRDGSAVAAVLVDLRSTRDVVLVNPHQDDDLNAAVVDHVRASETARDRTVEVREVARSAPGGDDTITTYVVLCGLLGFGFALVVSLLRGPVAATASLGVLRVGGLAIVSLGGVAALQLVPATRLPGNDLLVIALGAGYAFTLGVITLAVEALAGLVGLAAAAAAYSVLETPLLTGTSHHLLPKPWPQITPWLPTGAVHEALADVAYLDPGRATRPILVGVAAAAVALAVLLLARRLSSDAVAPGSTSAMSVRHWRLWVLGAVLPLAGVMMLAIALVPDEVRQARAVPRVASETTCLDQARRPTSLRDLDRQIETLQGSPAFQGADVGADVRLQDGRFLLVFGDTVRSASFEGPSFVRNSMMLWGSDCVSVVLPPSQGALIPDRLDKVGYWPMSTTVDHQPGYDLVLVSTQRVTSTGGGSFDFANLGPAVAVFIVPVGETPQLIASEDLGPDDDDTARPEWGAALAVDDGWLYAYGTAHPQDEGVFGFSLQVARVRPDDVLDQGKWRYWDGARWQRDAGAAQELIRADGGVSQTLSVFHRDGRWYALSKRNGDLGDQMAFWTAPSPTGPFTPAAAVATLPSDPATGAVTYMPLAHPEILPRRGTVVASYSRNNTDFDTILADPRRYRPRFLRVPLPR